MEKGAKIFIAGFAGMVGSAIFRRLEGEGFTNIVGSYHHRAPALASRGVSESPRLVHIDLRRQADVDALFEAERPEYVFLAAAKVGGILANSTYKADFIYDNIMIAANIIHGAFRYGTKKLLNLGSSCIYPKDSPQPMKEDYLLTGPLEPTNEPYAVAKISAIKLCRYFNEQYKTHFLSVMPANLYGPQDNFNLETSHVLPALLRKFYLAKLLKRQDTATVLRDVQRFPLGVAVGFDGETSTHERVVDVLERIGVSDSHVRIWGTGEVFREFLHVDDLADACVFLMKHFTAEDIGEFINIGTGKEIRLNELARLIQAAVGFDGEIRHDPSKPDGVKRKCLDVSRIRNLGWRPKIDLKEGLEETIRWYAQAVSEIPAARSEVAP
ncbi:MAG: GDP-L-fucose synthase [Deltaproteobacteria bacterium]|nr:GDP-L-fucose synthase [Deltaproteobacteria bacterium]